MPAVIAVAQSPAIATQRDVLTPATAPTAIAVDRAARFDRLANGSPADAFEALKMLRACNDLEAFTKMMSDATYEPKYNAAVKAMSPSRDACDGLTGGQRSELVPLAIKAAKGHVRGAFLQLAMLAGSDRYKDDPRIEADFESILAGNVAAAEPDALLVRYNYEMSCPSGQGQCAQDMRKALVYHTTMILAQPLATGTPDRVTPFITAQIGAAAAQAAIADGIAAYARRQP